jgi:hypothetical protein
MAPDRHTDPSLPALVRKGPAGDKDHGKARGQLDSSYPLISGSSPSLNVMIEDRRCTWHRLQLLKDNGQWTTKQAQSIKKQPPTGGPRWSPSIDPRGALAEQGSLSLFCLQGPETLLTGSYSLQHAGQRLTNCTHSLLDFCTTEDLLRGWTRLETCVFAAGLASGAEAGAKACPHVGSSGHGLHAALARPQGP